MWESPIYQFKLPKKNKVIELSINVTKSIPRGRVVSPGFRKSFGHVFSKYKKINDVVEFGAGSLKNCLYILKKGKTVHAVDYKVVLKNPQTKFFMKECEKFKNKFKSIIYPHKFINDRTRYDLAVLSHVLPIMPVLAERLLVLQCLHQKLRNNGLVLWQSLIDNSTYKKRRRTGAYECGDGIWIGKGSGNKTFFKKFEFKEIDEIMHLSGFSFVRKFEANQIDIRLYQRKDWHLFEGIISPDLFKTTTPLSLPKTSEITIDLTKDELPYEFSLKKIYEKRLDTIRSGDRTKENIFNRFAGSILWFCLYSQIGDMKILREIDGRYGKRTELVFRNLNTKGFFDDLRHLYNVNSPRISVECKNYSEDEKSPEIDQLLGRLDSVSGMLGFLICREVNDKDSLIKNLRLHARRKNEYIILLDDNDLKELINQRFISEEGVNDFLHEKYEELI